MDTSKLQREHGNGKRLDGLEAARLMYGGQPDSKKVSENLPERERDAKPAPEADRG